MKRFIVGYKKSPSVYHFKREGPEDLVLHDKDLEGPIREREINPVLVRRVFRGGGLRGENHSDHYSVFLLPCCDVFVEALYIISSASPSSKGVREGETPQEEVRKPPPRIGHNGLAALPVKGMDGLTAINQSHNHIHK